ncbi:MAG: hypothetical protein ACC662_00775 [Planctomycetota bacterium]
MARTYRLLPVLLVTAASLVAVIALGAPEPTGTASPTPRTAHARDDNAPPLLHAAPILPPVLVGRGLRRTDDARHRPIDAGDAVVTVVGPDGPRKDVGMDVFGLGKDRHRREWTDDEGQVHLEGVPFDGSVTVVVDGLPAEAVDTDSPERSVGRAHATIRAPETRIEIADRMPLTVTFRDVSTGRPLPRLPFRLDSDEPFEEMPTRPIEGRPGHYVILHVRPRSPPGLVAFDGVDFTADVSRRARALRLEATLRREARVYLRAVDPSGRSIPDAEFGGVEVSGEPVWGTKRTARDGERLRVHGVPFLRGERVRLLATRPSPRDRLIGDDKEVEEEEETEEVCGEDPLLPDDVWPWSVDREPGFASIARGRFPARRDLPLELVAVFDPATRVKGTNACFGIGGG